MYPIITDLQEPQSRYAMAINVDLSVATSAFELNYYDDSMSSLFGIFPELGPYFVSRYTTYLSDHGGMAYNVTHTKDMKRIQIAEDPNHRTNTHDQYSDLFTYHRIGVPYNSYRFPIKAGKDDVIIHESPGYYRVIYNWHDGIWTEEVAGTTSRTGSFNENQHLYLPFLNLQVPNFADYAHHCVYEPFLKMYRGDGSTEQLEQQGNRTFADQGRDLVLRTAAFGIEQGELQICAQRRDKVGVHGEVVLEGLGADLPLVVGLLASLRYNGWKAGKRGDCDWHR